MKVRDLMMTELVTLAPEDLVITAEELMGLRRFRRMPVIDKEGKLVGLMTHRDLLAMSESHLRKGSWLENQKLKAITKVSEVMRKQVKTVDPDDTLLNACGLILNHKYGCLPVVTEDGKLVGILTEADFVRLAAAALAHLDKFDPAMVEGLKRQVANQEHC